MIRVFVLALVVTALALVSRAALASDEGGHHLPHNHIALVFGAAFEEQSDGHRERGHIIGFEYVRQVSEHWGWGVAAESEWLGDKHHRLGIMAIPVSYFPNERWRLLAGPGIEFRDRGEPDHALFRIGAGYEFELGEHFTFSPEVIFDFVEGGTNVYILGFSVGYGF